MRHEPTAPKIKVVPNVLGAIGLRHPVDGALDKDGSRWTLDTFTTRKLHDGSIRRAEVVLTAPAKVEPKQVTAAAAPVGGKREAKA